jgi:hypothetical protein
VDPTKDRPLMHPLEDHYDFGSSHFGWRQKGQAGASELYLGKQRREREVVGSEALCSEVVSTVM